MTRRRIVPAVVLVLGLVAATVAFAATRGGDDNRLTIGALYPTSGPQGEGGSEELRGVQLAADWANDHGGVNAKSVRLRAVDVERAEAVPTAMRALHADGVDLVVGSHGSAISAAAAQVASDERMLFWETGAVGLVGPEVDSGRSFFRLAPMGANLGRAGMTFIFEQMASRLGVDRPLSVAVAYVDDVYGRAVSGGAIEAASAGGVLAGTFPYDAATADFDDLARRIAGAHPDVLFVVAYIDDGVALRAATVRQGVHLLASIGTSSSYCHPAFGDRLGDAAVGLFASDKPDAAHVQESALTSDARAALRWVTAEYTRRWHTDMSAAALSGFSNASALFSAVLPAARTATPAAVAAAALTTKLPVGSLANGGGLDLAPPGAADAGENRNAASVIWEWVAVRTRAVVWPPAFATHAIEALPIQ